MAGFNGLSDEKFIFGSTSSSSNSQSKSATSHFVFTKPKFQERPSVSQRLISGVGDVEAPMTQRPVFSHPTTSSLSPGKRAHRYWLTAVVVLVLIAKYEYALFPSGFVLF